MGKGCFGYHAMEVPRDALERKKLGSREGGVARPLVFSCHVGLDDVEEVFQVERFR